MKNVTISMDEELYRLTRIEAAKAGLSVSRFMAQAAQEKISQQAQRLSQAEAMKQFLSGPRWHILEDGRLPNADERNERR